MVRACIFDLGGTIVDKYSYTPLKSFKQIFTNRGISISHEMVIKDMGRHKLDHIKYILREPPVRYQWIRKYNRPANYLDIDKLFNEFKIVQYENTLKHLDILPETKSTLNMLQKMDIKIGITTGFDKETTENILYKLGKHNIYVDSYVSSTCLNKPGRPYPHMVEENMRLLNIDNPNDIIKIDDTNVGIDEGINANCWTIGVSRWSINMNIDSLEMIDTIENNPKLLHKKMKESRLKLEQSNPDYIINTLYELPNIISKIDSYLKI